MSRHFVNVVGVCTADHLSLMYVPLYVCEVLFILTLECKLYNNKNQWMIKLLLAIYTCCVYVTPMNI